MHRGTANKNASGVTDYSYSRRISNTNIYIIIGITIWVKHVAYIEDETGGEGGGNLDLII